MVVRGRDLAGLVEEYAPISLAEPWDRVGWQLGDPGRPVDRVMLALDPCAVSLEEAAHRGVGLMVTHHPLFLKPLPRICLDEVLGRLVSSFLQQGIGLYVAHTNLDRARDGVSAILAQRLGLSVERTLGTLATDEFLKLCVFVPQTHLDQVREALTVAGAGQVGDYSDCTFAVRGTGTFRPGPGANPFVGSTGELARVDEARLETIVPIGRLKAVLAAMLSAHPYEEVAYDLYTLQNRFGNLGLGSMGSLSSPVNLATLGSLVKAALGVSHVRCGGAPDRVLQRVAVSGGSGASLWREAHELGAEVLVTGEVKYHEGQDMLAEGLCFIDAGHAATERIILPVLAAFLERRCRDKAWPVAVDVASKAEEPFWYL